MDNREAHPKPVVFHCIDDMKELHWFAAYTRNNFARSVRRRLTEAGIECYMPERIRERTYNGRRRRISVPLIPNMIFIRSTREKCYDLTNELSLPIRYILDRNDHRPAPIADNQMRDFRLIVETPDEMLTLVNIPLAAGDRVRVTAGPFMGIEGELIRIKGHRRVVVRLNDIVSVATAYIPAPMLEKI